MSAIQKLPFPKQQRLTITLDNSDSQYVQPGALTIGKYRIVQSSITTTQPRQRNTQLCKAIICPITLHTGEWMNHSMNEYPEAEELAWLRLIVFFSNLISPVPHRGYKWTWVQWWWMDCWCWKRWKHSPLLLQSCSVGVVCCVFFIYWLDVCNIKGYLDFITIIFFKPRGTRATLAWGISVLHSRRFSCSHHRRTLRSVNIYSSLPTLTNHTFKSLSQS